MLPTPTIARQGMLASDHFPSEHDFCFALNSIADISLEAGDGDDVNFVAQTIFEKVFESGQVKQAKTDAGLDIDQHIYVTVGVSGPSNHRAK
jgi:hypothetical protein